MEELAAIGASRVKNARENNVLNKYNKIYGSLWVNNGEGLFFNNNYYNHVIEIILTLLLEASGEYDEVGNIFNDEEVVDRIIEACCYHMGPDLFYIDEVLIFVLYFISNKKIIELASKEEFNWKRKLLSEDQVSFFINKDMVSKVFQKVLKVILNFELETPLIQILPYCVLSNYSDITQRLYPKLDVEYLHGIRYKNIVNEMARIILCLFDVNMNVEKKHEIIERIKEIYKDEFVIFEYIVLIFEKSRINGIWAENFLVEIYNLIKRGNNVDINLLSRYESCIRNVIESCSTELYND